MAKTLASASVLPLPGVKAGVFLLPGPPAILIDSGMRGQHRRVLRCLKRAGVEPRSVAIIALTHWHIDHTGSAGLIQQATGAHVAAHRADAPIIQGFIPPAKPDLRGEGGKFARWLLVKLYRHVTVHRLLEAGDMLPEAGGLRVIGTPGHTAGHVCFYLEREGILFAGDALMHRDGELSLPSPNFSQDQVQVVRSLAALRALRFDTCYFGHGEPIIGGADRRVASFLDRLAEGTAKPEGR